MKYTCPMHPEITQDHPGKCPKCGMGLVLESSLKKKKSKFETYKPLIVIIGMILLVTVTLSIRDALHDSLEIRKTMSYFMAGFFLVFSAFKFLDLKGFADGYRTYDLLAKRWYTYGCIYPFLELLLGLAFLIGFDSFWVNGVTLVLMTFSGIGVLAEKQKKKTIQCACLGTIFKLPLTNITLIEDFGMAAMALLMMLL